MGRRRRKAGAVWKCRHSIWGLGLRRRRVEAARPSGTGVRLRVRFWVNNSSLHLVELDVLRFLVGAKDGDLGVALGRRFALAVEVRDRVRLVGRKQLVRVDDVAK